MSVTCLQNKLKPKPKKKLEKNTGKKKKKKKEIECFDAKKYKLNWSVLAVDFEKRKRQKLVEKKNGTVANEREKEKKLKTQI